ncbi:hypothetical protein C8Q79DRAFT_991336 [Trametes meyenii]|nr:hypothetical protein C8Q79DRAFT_991336 [Trametes meyenii]
MTRTQCRTGGLMNLLTSQSLIFPWLCSLTLTTVKAIGVRSQDQRGEMNTPLYTMRTIVRVLNIGRMLIVVFGATGGGRSPSEVPGHEGLLFSKVTSSPRGACDGIGLH